MLLSACMIVKNETLTIRKCLASLQGVVDEIIVVDTGSTDDTPDIARECGAHVFSFIWQNDFSQARNESLRHAHGDWILVIDADEYLDEQKKQSFRSFLQSSDAEGVFITQKNYLGSLRHVHKAMPIRVMRVFRRGHLYEGAIHEQIALSVERTQRPVALFDLDLHHIGYTDEFVRQRGKTDRNSTLLHEELAHDPDNVFHRSNLLAEYILQKQYHVACELAQETWLRIRRMPKTQWPNFAVRILLHGVAALWETGQHEEAIRLAEEGLREFPWFTDLKKHYANMLTQRGKIVGAIRVLEACRAQGDTKEGLIEFTEGMGTYLAAMDLGINWSLLGDDMVARRWYLQAFLENPTLDAVIIPLGWLMPPEPSFLQEHLEARIVDGITYGNYIEILAIRNVPRAMEVLERAVEKFGISEMTERSRMALLRLHGRDAMLDYAVRMNAEIHWLCLGIDDLNQSNYVDAKEMLSLAGTRGEYIWKTHELLSSTVGSHWGMKFVLRDLIAMHAENLLRAWLPVASDLKEVWLHLKYSPLGHLLTEVTWPGDTVLECEQNALRCFHEKQLDEATQWLQKANTFELTVTQVLLTCDVALAKGDVTTARKVVYEAKKNVFPDSELIKQASLMIHPKVDASELSHQLAKTTSERLIIQ